MTRTPCPTCGQRFRHLDDCTAVSHLHQGSSRPGSAYFRHPCRSSWQLTAINARDAFASWLYQADHGRITDPVHARHQGLARRFRDALHATTVYWLPTPPAIEFTIQLPGRWQIWIETVPGYRCQWHQRQSPTSSDTRTTRAALRQLEILARHVTEANCPCQYRLHTIPGTQHPQHCGCFCHHR